MINAPLIEFNPGIGTGDISFTNGDITRAHWLASAVYISLFTDQRVEAGELSAGQTDQRGSWSDVFLREGESQGSRLHLLKNGKLSEQTLQLAHDYAQAALLWLLDDNHVRTLRVTPARYKNSGISLLIELTLLDGSPWQTREEFLLNGR